MKEPWNWVYSDLALLIGARESMTLEFKSCMLLNNSKDEITRTLSKTASAFANSIGGTIVIGISEKKEGKTRVGNLIEEGIEPSCFPPEQLQRLIETNLFPYLPGVRINPVALKENPTKIAYVISIPQGSTAYQAIDGKYYGRSEFESRHLPDHEIRLRMFRQKAQNGRIIINNQYLIKNFHTLESALKNFGGNKAEIELAFEGKNPLTPQEFRIYCYNICLENVGEVNIKEFKTSLQLQFDGVPREYQIERSYRDGIIKPSKSSFFAEIKPKQPLIPEDVNIYPNEKFVICHENHRFFGDNVLENKKIELKWLLHLPDSIPVAGTINVNEAIKDAKLKNGGLTSA